MSQPSKKPPLRIGEVFLGEYQVLEAIGRGGYGCVYRAREEFTGREVALKIITCDVSGSRVSRDTFERGRQEAKILAEIEHPHIVNVFRAGQTEDGHIYIVMELLRGQSLAQRLKEGPIEVEEGLRIIEALTDALQLVHSKNIAHRDIKPGNIIIRDDGVAKLVDFGIAKVAGGGGAHTAPNQVPGTGLYISPEQLYSVISKGPRPPFELGDIYALGLVAFQMFQGTHPFLMLEPHANFGNPQIVWKFHMETRVPHLDEVIEGFPSAVALLVATALAKDPGDRLRSMSEFGAKAKTARLNFLGRKSEAHFLPLSGGTPEKDGHSPGADLAPSPETAPIAPRGTQKQFNTDAPTQFVDIPVATIERHERESDPPPRGTNERPASQPPSSNGYSAPATPHAGSRTVTLPRLNLKRKSSNTTLLALVGGGAAGILIVLGLFPLAEDFWTSNQPDPLEPGEFVVESVEPLPLPEKHEPSIASAKPAEGSQAEKPEVEAPADAEPKETPPDEATTAAVASTPPAATQPVPQAPRKPAPVAAPRPVTRKVPKKAKADWKDELDGSGWLD